jgi:hypothetical protein
MQSVIKAGGMDDVLLGIVLERLGKYPPADEAVDPLLAAFESEEACLRSSAERLRGARPLIRPLRPRRSLRARTCSR